jgi:predicted transcriptional regulator
MSGMQGDRGWGVRRGEARWYRGRSGLRGIRRRITLCYMKAATVTIRLDAKLERELDRLCRKLGRSRSEVVRDALHRQIALLRFEDSRRAILPLAEAQGILTDEDVFRIVS